MLSTRLGLAPHPTGGPTAPGHANVAPLPQIPLRMLQDIQRGRQMVDSLFQGGQGMGGTHNAIMSSTDYLSTAQVCV